MITKLRLWVRMKYDSLFCRSGYSVERLGTVDVWNVSTLRLQSDSIVYSAGVGLGISFEKELVARFGLMVYLFDPSPTGITTMAKPENQMSRIESRVQQ